MARAAQDGEKLEPSGVADGDVKWCRCSGRQFHVPQKLNTEWPDDPAISLFWVYPPKVKAGTHTDSCTPVFTVALFTTAKGGNNPSVHQQADG